MTQQYKAIHLGGLPCALGLTLYGFLISPHSLRVLAVALLFDVLVVGWPILLQRYNRVRIEGILDPASASAARVASGRRPRARARSPSEEQLR